MQTNENDSGLKLEPPGVRASRLQIERDAVRKIWCDWSRRSEPYGATEGEIEHSKAISLKRIADALNGQALTRPASAPGDEMVERVARALRFEGVPVLDMDTEWSKLEPQGRENWRRFARAAITAIKGQ